MLRAKGRLVSEQISRQSTPEQKRRGYLERAAHKLGGTDVRDKLSKQWDEIRVVKNKVNEKIGDGLILSLLQQNLSTREIRAMFCKAGVSKINRIRKIMEDPKSTSIQRKPPPHAASSIDIDNISAHLGTFDTEDGFPCAHRRPRKFFIQQGLTWVKI